MPEIIPSRRAHSPNLRRFRPTASAVLAALGLLCGLALVVVALAAHSIGRAAFDLAVLLLAIVAFGALLWRGFPSVLAAPVVAVPIILLSSPNHALAVFQTDFATPAGAFFGRYFLIFLMGAVFGQVMVATGCAAGLAKFAVARQSRPLALLSVSGLAAAMTLGGVGVFVIAFAVFPIAKRILERAGLPVGLAPAAIAFGAFTVTMTALPGTPSLTNIIAGSILGTNAYAAPVPGTIAALVMGGFGCLWLWRAAGAAPLDSPQEWWAKNSPITAGQPSTGEAAHPKTVTCALPLVVTLATNIVLAALTQGLTSAPGFGEWGAAYWCVIVSLILGSLTAVAVGKRTNVLEALSSAAVSAMGPLAGTALCVGFGTVLASSSGVHFALSHLGDLVGTGSAAFVAIVASFYAFAAGSSSGGLALALELHGEEFLSADLTMGQIHRFASLGAGTLDTLPHSAAVVSLLTICGTTHAVAYRGVFATTVIGPILGLAVALLLAS